MAHFDQSKQNVETQYNADLISFLTPENVTMIVSLVGASIGITTTAIKGIQTWVDERKSRKISIKYKDIELEISGAQSDAEIEKAILHFSNLKEKISKEDVKIEVVKE